MARFRLTLGSMFLVLGLILVPVFGWLWWHLAVTVPILADITSEYSRPGEAVRNDLERLAPLAFDTHDKDFLIQDHSGDGIKIEFANAEEEKRQESEESPAKVVLDFPKDYVEPIQVTLADGRSIGLTDRAGERGYTAELVKAEALASESDDATELGLPIAAGDRAPQYLRYQSEDGRKDILYAYQSDGATGERKLRHWTLYRRGTGFESESYHFDRAKLRLRESGEAVVYFDAPALADDAEMKGVETSLLERAQRTLTQDMADEIDSGDRPPDAVIPRPFIVDRSGEKTLLDWRLVEDDTTLTLSFAVTSDRYPVALDPTLSFTAPQESNTGEVIAGEATSTSFGFNFATGDFNADGRVDLAVGARAYTTNTGRAYIFYNDGAYPATAGTADVTITGEATSNYFGRALTAGDFNADGKTDLAIGAYGYTTNTGRTYLFYNDGSYPSVAASADVIITGQGTTNLFGVALTAGDFNADGKTDLAVGASAYGTDAGRAYIFYNDGSYPSGAASASVIIDGEGKYFGVILATGDFNADGKTDLSVGAYGYASYLNTGRAYIFYNDGSIPTTAATADVIITGEATSNSFGIALTSGDFNADGKTDLAVGAYQLSTSAGRAYIFYNDGSYPSGAASADVIITGDQASLAFGYNLASGDFNADGRTDLAVGAYSYSTQTGRAYIFYNDGSYPSSTAAADVVMTGEATGNYFGFSFGVGDFNADGNTDLVTSSEGYASSTGRVYILYSQNGQVAVSQNIAGETTSNYFGYWTTAGDFNADGRTDLAVGAYGYSTNTGRAYIFYNDGSIPTTATAADVTITGEATSNYFGYTVASGDFNADGRTDLAVGAMGYSSNTGRTYLFYNDGSIPTTAATADVIITGNAVVDRFGNTLAVGDFNADGRTDLAVAARDYNGAVGRTYLFYNDGSIPTTAATADVTITGAGGSSYFGYALVSGDFNTDGTTDLAVSAYGADSSNGRAYIFYNDGSIPTTAATADVTITGQGGVFGYSITSGDLNADGRTDLAVGAYGYSTNTGRAYIFYNDGSIPTTAATADVIFSGEGVSNAFGIALATGDLNADGRTDLAVGAYNYSSTNGRAYVFYNDGVYPSPANADVIITGEAASDALGYGLSVGDFNADGRTDLAVAAYGTSTNTGTVYFYTSRENFAWQLQKQVATTPRTGLGGSGQELRIGGESASSEFSKALVAGDFNADGEIDLVVGAPAYASNQGRVYVFYADGSLPSAAGNGDVVITASSTVAFGTALAAGDFNADGRTDLAVGATGCSTNTGCVYIFYNDGSLPTTMETADLSITGAASDDLFGTALASGDFNADGETDLAISATGYSTSTGRTYIFHNDGSIPTTAGTADVTITGNASGDTFGIALASGDFNADGEIDFAIGAAGYSTSTGRAYLFYNDGSIPTTAATADVTITGEATSNSFGVALAAGDFNTDSKTDLAVGASGYSSGAGRAYIFHNDGSIPTTAATADVTISGSAENFGSTLAVGDFNADGRTDLAVGAPAYSTNTGRAYLFSNDGSYPSASSSADMTITGEATSSYFGSTLAAGDFNADGRTDLAIGVYGYATSTGQVSVYTLHHDPAFSGEATNNYFGYALAAGDFNADGRTDLAVGAYGYSTNTGRAYIFHSDNTYPSSAASADVTITGNAAGDAFGYALVAGDFNADGRTDLAIGAPWYSTNTGRAYLFHNDGSIPTTAGSADVTITGETTSNYFGAALVAGDLNTDGEIDLAVGAYGYSTNTGRAYIFHNDGSIPTTAATADVTITGNASGDAFGLRLATGDLNADSKTDLAIGAPWYSTNTGRAYLFHNDGSIPTTATTADVTITGETTNNYFGSALATGGLNRDATIDLAIGAYGYSTNTGRAYIFHNDGSIPTTADTADVTITGAGYLAERLAIADLNADGWTDLIVSGQPTSAGKVSVFYNDGSYSTSVSAADLSMTGDTSGDVLGAALAIGDFNDDGIADLAVGASGYASSAGQAAIFASEVATASASFPGVSSFKGNGTMKGNMKWK